MNQRVLVSYSILNMKNNGFMLGKVILAYIINLHESLPVNSSLFHLVPFIEYMTFVKRIITS